jgi:hypothetical protein
MISWVKYVKHAEKEQHEALGWVANGDMGPIYGHFRILMEWTGDGDPPNVDDQECAGAGNEKTADRAH